MRSIHDTPPVFIGDIDLGDSTILRVDILPSDRRVRYSILRRAGAKLAFLDSFAIDVSHLPQLQMLTVNANARARIECDELQISGKKQV
jgi:hypothetical protein